MCRTCRPSLGAINFGKITGQAISRAAQIVSKNAEQIRNTSQSIVTPEGKAYYTGETAPKSGSYQTQTTQQTTQTTATGPGPTVPANEDNTALYIVGGLALATVLYLAFK